MLCKEWEIFRKPLCKKEKEVVKIVKHSVVAYIPKEFTFQNILQNTSLTTFTQEDREVKRN